MKQPRIADFDPNAKERSLISSMDNFPTIESPKQKLQEPMREKHNHTLFPSPEAETKSTPTALPIPRTGYPLPKRKMKERQPFDVYEDQVTTLKKIAEDERKRGLPGSMSRMVRESIDLYLAKRFAKENK